MSDTLEMIKQAQSELGTGSLVVDPREQEILNRFKVESESETQRMVGQAKGEMAIDARRKQRAYAESNPDLAPAAEAMISNLGSRDEVLKIMRLMNPQQREEALYIAGGLAQKLGDDRGGILGRTMGAIQRGVSHGVSQPLQELLGMGGTPEEIEYIRKLDAVAAQEFNPSIPSDPMLARGALQATEMLPWMTTVVGGGGLGRTVATNVGGKVAASAAAGSKVAGTVQKAGQVVGALPTKIPVVGKYLPALTAGKAGELAGITAASFPGQYAQEVDQLKQLGMKDGRALRMLAGGTAAITGLIEGIVPDPFGAKKVTLTQGASRAAREYLWEAAKKAPGEITEEYLQGVTSGLGKVVAGYIDENAQDKTITDAFNNGWEQTKEAALPMAFLLGVPAMGGAGAAAARARRIQLEEIRAKGFVSAEDAKVAGIEGKNRKERAANVDAMIEQAKAEEAQASEVDAQGTAQEVMPAQPEQVDAEAADIYAARRAAQQGQQTPPPLPDQQQVPPPLPTPAPAGNAEVSDTAVPQPTEAEPGAIGERTRMMDTPVIRAKSVTDDNNVRYELFEADDGKAIIRSMDLDSGELVSMKKYPSMDAAQKDFGDVEKPATPTDAASVDPASLEQPAPTPVATVPATKTMGRKDAPKAVDEAKPIEPSNNWKSDDRVFVSGHTKASGGKIPSSVGKVVKVNADNVVVQLDGETKYVAVPKDKLQLPDAKFTEGENVGIPWSAEKTGTIKDVLPDGTYKVVVGGRQMSQTADQMVKLGSAEAKPADIASVPAKSPDAVPEAPKMSDDEFRQKTEKLWNDNFEKWAEAVDKKFGRTTKEQKQKARENASFNASRATPDRLLNAIEEVLGVKAIPDDLQQRRTVKKSDVSPVPVAKTPKEQPLKKDTPKATQAPRAMEPTEEGRPVDGKPVLPGDRFLTNTGRETTPYPKYDGSTNRKVIAGEKRSQQWLIENAIAEAESRGDDFNATTFRSELEEAKKGKLPQASKDSATLYVFGDYVPKVPKSILKDIPKQPESKSPDTVSGESQRDEEVKDAPKTKKGGDPNEVQANERQGQANANAETKAEAQGQVGDKGGQASATPSPAASSDGKPKPPKGYKPLEEFTPAVTQTLSPDLELQENRDGIKELGLKKGEAVGYRVYPKRGSSKGGYWKYGIVRYDPTGSHASIELEDGTAESVGGARLHRLEPIGEQANKKPMSKWEKGVTDLLSTVPAFKGASFELNQAKNTAKVVRPDGLSTTIHFNADADLKEMATKKGSTGAFGAYVRKMGKKGKWAEGEIYLRSDAGSRTINHEVVHWLQDLGIITDAEIEKHGGREGLADAYGKWAEMRSRPADTLFEKIYDFLEQIFDVDARFFKKLNERVDATKDAMHYPDGSSYRKWMNRKHRIGDKPTSYLSGHSSDSVRQAAKENPGLGLVITPANPGYVGHGGDYSHVMIDNGAFSEFTGTAPFNEDKFFALLDKVVAAGLKDKVQHVVVPDKVGDWQGTTERWKQFYERVKAYGMPLAYVGQDGIEENTDQIPWDQFDVFFIGGSTPWKLGFDPKGEYKDFNRPTDDELRKAGYNKAFGDLLKEAKRLGKRVHMGRVNSWKRMDMANYGMQVDSVDGNFIGAAPDKNLPIVTSWLRDTGGEQFKAEETDTTSVQIGDIVERNGKVGVVTRVREDGVLSVDFEETTASGKKVSPRYAGFSLVKPGEYKKTGTTPFPATLERFYSQFGEVPKEQLVMQASDLWDSLGEDDKSRFAHRLRRFGIAGAKKNSKAETIAESIANVITQSKGVPGKLRQIYDIAMEYPKVNNIFEDPEQERLQREMMKRIDELGLSLPPMVRAAMVLPEMRMELLHDFAKQQFGQDIADAMFEDVPVVSEDVVADVESVPEGGMSIEDFANIFANPETAPEPSKKREPKEAKPKTKSIEFTEIKQNKSGVTRTVNAFDGNKRLVLELNRSQGSWSIREDGTSKDTVDGIIDLKKAKNVATRILEGTFDVEGDDKFVSKDSTNIGYSNAKLVDRVPVSTREAFASTLKATGVFSDGRVLIRVNDKDKDALLAKLPKPGGRVINVERLIEDGREVIRFKDNEFAAVGYRGGDVTDRTVFLRNGNGGFAIIDKAYHDTILQKHPTAKFFGSAERYRQISTPVAYSVDGEIVGLVMPILAKRIDGRLKSMIDGTYVFSDQPEVVKPRSVRKDKNKGVEEGLKEASEGFDLIRKGLKDLGSTTFAGNPINADIARGLGMVANGLIKAGKYKFAEFLDEAVKAIGAPAVKYLAPYLEAGWSKKAETDSRLDKAGKVSDYFADVVSVNYGTVEKPNRVELGKHFAKRLAEGASYPRITDARKEAADLIGGMPKDGTSAIKDIDEAVEIGVVRAARDIAQSEQSDEAIYDRLVDLYDRQPNLGTRTSTSMAEQAYSTPAPLAFVINRRAGVTSGDTVYDSSAGNGMLLIVGDKRYANELNPDRAESLRGQGIETTSKDATEFKLGKSIDALVINPPFGQVKDEAGNLKWWNIDGVRTEKVDHAITLQSMKEIPNNGKVAIIIGAKGFEKSEPKSDSRRGAAYLADKRFYDSLYDNYNVVDHFTVHGDLYSRQGATFPVDVIVVDGKGKSQRPKPYNITGGGIPQVVRTWEELKDGKLRPVDRTSSADTRGDEGADTKSVESSNASSPSGNAERLPTKSTRGGVGTADGRKSRPERLGKPNEQSGVANSTDAERPMAERADGDRPRRDDRGQRDVDKPIGSDRVDRVKPDETAETDYQVSYSPGSRNQSVDTLIPRNHQSAVAKSLDSVAELYGDVDDFVADEIGFTDEEMKSFSAEQVDALALAIARHKDGGAFILGDQTGVGKGRVVAAMMIYANRQGLVPVFITEKPTLYADMMRDIIDIGRSTEEEPFNVLMTNSLSGKNVVPLPDGRELKQSPAAAKRNLADVVESVNSTGKMSVKGKAIGKGKDKTYEEISYNAIFTTYSQLQPVKQLAPVRATLLKNIASKSFYILDESHNAGGGEDSNPTANQERRSSGQEATITRAEIVRDLIGDAAGVYFSSATYAKRPQTMGLYARTGMTAATDNDAGKLSEAIAEGGVPLQQVVSEQLVESGMYLRRERSFDGVAFDPKTVAVDLAKLDKISSIFEAINVMDGYAQIAIEDLADDITSDGGSIRDTEATGEAGVESTSFSSILHNLVDQMLLAVKADSIAEETIASIKNGESPVIYVDSTLEAALKRQVDELEANQGEVIDFSYRDLLRRYLERSREYTIREDADDADTVTRIRLTDEQLGPAGVAAYENALAMIDSFSENIPASPIDWIRKIVSDAGYSIGEITGRQVVLDYGDDGLVRLGKRPDEESGSGGRTTTVSRFNNGSLDAVLINQSGSTGISMHASEKFDNQKPRHMIIGQPARNIDTFMQALGRVHRTGQVVLPRFTLMMTDAPAEIRPASVLVKKLASLNANVTASAKGSVSFDVPDVINILGDQIVAEYLADNLELDFKLGELVQIKSNGTPKRNAGIAKKASGRMALRPVAEQKQFWDSVVEAYDELVNELNRIGKNPLIASTLDLQAKTIESTVIFEGDSSSDNAFSQPASIEMVRANKPGTPMTTEEITDTVTAFYGKPVSKAVVNEWLSSTIEDATKAFGEYITAQTKGLSEKDASNAKTGFWITGNQQLKNLKTRLMAHAPGTSVSVYDRNADGSIQDIAPGFVIRAKRSKGGNPLTASKWTIDVAIASPDRIAKTTLSRTGDQSEDASANYREFLTNQELMTEASLKEFSETDSSPTEMRYVGVGNILAAYSQLGKSGGKVTFFTDSSGAVRRGVLMPRSFKIDKWQEARPVVLDTVDQAREFMSAGGYLMTPDKALNLMMVGNQLVVRAPKAKSRGGKYTLNPTILKASSPMEFVSIGGRMEMVITNPSQKNAVLEAIMSIASLQANNESKKLARRIKENGNAEAKKDLANKVEKLPETLYQTSPNDINKDLLAEAVDLAIAAEDAGIRTYDQLVAFSVKTIGEDRTRTIGVFLYSAGKAAGMKGVRPTKDVLGFKGMTRDQAVTFAKVAFPMLTDEQIEAGIQLQDITAFGRDEIGYAPYGSPVPGQGLYQASGPDRLSMNFKDVTKRIPELQEAAKKLKAGELSREEYAEIVDKYKPVLPYDKTPVPATPEQAKKALGAKSDKYGVPSQTLVDGDQTQLRLDIPAYTNHGIWVVSVHKPTSATAFDAGKVVGYESAARLTDVKFGMKQNKTLEIAAGGPKGTFATINGKWAESTPEEISQLADEAMSDPSWVQVGMDPERHGYFYNRATMEPIVSADDLLQVGPLGLAKNPTYADPSDFMYQQQNAGNVKGWTSFISATRAIIGATDKANVSTFIHEFFHPMRRFLLDRSVPESKRFGITDNEIKALEDYSGVKDGEWTVEAEEKAAKAWEQYWLEGKSPTTKLDSLFEKISKWMQKVYKGIKQITGGSLPVEVSNLFDKLVQRGLPADERATDTMSGDEGPLTSIKNAIMNELREMRGMPQLADAAVQTQQEWLDEAEVQLRQDPLLGSRLVQELSDNARNLSNIEVAVLQLYYRQMNNQLEEASEKWFTAKDDGDAVQSARMKTDVDLIMKNLATLEEASKKAGREWGRAGVARQIALAKDFSLASILRKARIANAGNELNEEQLLEMQELAERVGKLEGALAEATQKIMDLERQQNTDKGIEEEKKRVGTPAPKSKSRQNAASKVLDFAKKFAGIFSIKQTGTDTLQQTEEERMVDEAETVVQAYVEAGVHSFGEFIAQVKKDLGGELPMQAQIAFAAAWQNIKAQGDIPSPTVDRTNASAMTRFARKIQRMLVESGITERNEVVEAVRESLAEMDIELSKREVMDALSGYGQFTPLSKDEIDIIIRQMNSELLEEAKIADLESGVAPKATGQQRPEMTPKQRELRRKVNELKRTSKYFITDKDAQLKTMIGAAMTAATNRIYDLKKAIKEKEAIVKTSVDLTGKSAELDELRKELAEWTAKYKAMFPRPGVTDAQRLKAAIQATDRAIADIEKQLNTGNVMPKGRKDAVVSEELTIKQARLDSLREMRYTMRMDQDPKYKDKIAEKLYKANLMARIADYQDRANRGYFDPKPKKELRKLSDEELRLKKELQDAKDEFFRKAGLYRLEHMSPRERAWDWVKETTHLSRAFMTSIDLSAVFRQGGIASFSHPKLASEAAKEMYNAMKSEQAEFKTAEEIRGDKLYDFAIQAGLEITTDSEKITKQEEAYMGRWAKHGFGKKGSAVNDASQFILTPISASARAYTTFLNSMRFKLFKQFVSTLGADGQLTLDEAKVLASFINVSTGRGDLGKWNQTIANASLLFFAPRYVISRVQYFAMPFYVLPSSKVSGRVKKLIAQEYARYGLGLSLFMGAVAILGRFLTDDEDEWPTIELDPRSSDFMKIKIGETRIDTTSGLSQIVTFATQVGIGQKKRPDGEIRDMRGEKHKWGDDNTWDVMTDFVRKKFAPVPGAATNVIVRENVVGDEVTPLTAVRDLLIPLSFREIANTMESRDVPSGLVISALALLGMGGGTYGPKTKYMNAKTWMIFADEAKRKELFDKDLDKMEWNSPNPAYEDFLTAGQLEQVNQRREERKQDLVVEALGNPQRDSFLNEDNFTKAVARRDEALKAAKDAGMTYAEVKQLTLDYWKRVHKSPFELKKGRFVMRDAVVARLREARKVFDEN